MSLMVPKSEKMGGMSKKKKVVGERLVSHGVYIEKAVLYMLLQRNHGCSHTSATSKEYDGQYGV